MEPSTYAVIWLIVAAAFFVAEGVTVQLVGVWFGFGSLVAMLAGALGAPFWLQMLLFLLSSIMVLILGRPIAMEHLRVRKQPTNADRVIGQIGLVREEINNMLQVGRIHVSGLDWSARSVSGQVLPAGIQVVVRQIDGVKLIVDPLEPAAPEPPPPSPGLESAQSEISQEPQPTETSTHENGGND